MDDGFQLYREEILIAFLVIGRGNPECAYDR